MINIKSILELMKINDHNVIRVQDLNKNNLFELKGTSPEAAFAELEKLFPILKDMQRLLVKTINEAKSGSNWTGAAVYTCFFENNASTTSLAAPAPAAAPSNDLMDLKVTVMKLELQRDHDKKIKELEDKLNKGEDYSQYLPFLGKALGWDGGDMINMIQQSAMLKNPQMQLAGPPAVKKENVTVQGTAEEEEKFKTINVLMESIYVTHGPDKIIKLLQALVNKPGLVDTALQFIK